MPSRTAGVLQPKLPGSGDEIPDLLPLAGFDSIYATKMIMIVFLRWLFEEGGFQGLVWNLDQRETEIIIGDKNQSYSEEVMKKPRIIIDRGPIQWDNLSFDKTLGAGGLGEALLRDGVPLSQLTGDNYVFPGNVMVSDTLSGSLNVVCYAEEGLLAERLASFVFMNIRAFRDKLRKMGFMSIDSSGIGRERAEFATSNYRLIGVPVTVRFSLWVTMLREPVEELITNSDCGLFEKINMTTNMVPPDKPCFTGCPEETEYTATAQAVGSTTVVVSSDLDEETPASGKLRIFDYSTSRELRLRYSSWDDRTFQLASVPSGTADAGSSGVSLIDLSASFLSTVKAGDLIRNTTEQTYGYVTTVVSDTELLTNSAGSSAPILGWEEDENYAINQLPVATTTEDSVYVQAAG